MIKVCKYHGETEFIFEKRGYHRCKKCRSESVTNKRVRNKTKLIEMFGGECVRCGYSKNQNALQFHHRNPEDKSFGIGSSTGMCRAFHKLVEEAKKCDIVCANCHAEIHSVVV